MAILKKNPFAISDSKPYYTLGLNKTILVVGLGNVGQNYVKTRHNAGFIALEAFAEAHSAPEWSNKKDLKCLITQIDINNTRVILCKPTTMMNLSGEAVQAVMNFYKIALSDLVVVHDELDVDFGKLRCRKGGSAAGNNGIKSIIQHAGKEFDRIRIGIGPKTPEQIDSADFVLMKFSKDEQAHLKDLKREITALLTERVATGQLPHETISFLV